MHRLHCLRLDQCLCCWKSLLDSIVYKKKNVIFINNISICSHFRITTGYLQYIVLPCVELFHICPWNSTFRCLLTMFYISIFVYCIYCIVYTLHRYNPISFKMDNLCYSNIFHMIHWMLWSATVVYFFRRLTFEKMIDFLVFMSVVENKHGWDW